MKFQHHGIQAANGILLAFILIGLPAAAAQNIGPWRVSSPSQLHTLLLWSLSLAAGLNLLALLTLVRVKKNRTLCRLWITAHLVLALIQWLLLKEHLTFHWLKDLLLKL